MKNLMQGIARTTVVGTVSLFGSFLSIIPNAQAAEPQVYHYGPVIKNLTGLTYRAPATRTDVPRDLTGKEVKHLIASAESSKDHLKLARYFRDKADRLDFQASGYEAAAADFRQGPFVKNLMAPGTAARWEYFAKGLREQATASRDLAVSHEQTAKIAIALLR
jgi:hypothetical protein